VVQNSPVFFKAGDAVVIGEGAGTDLNGYTGTFTVTAIGITNSYLPANYAFQFVLPGTATGLAEVTSSPDGTASSVPATDGHVDPRLGGAGFNTTRAVARLGDVELGLYGKDPYETSRIDSFLDASLVFARDSQIYLLALGSGSLSEEIYHRTREAFAVYMAGINSALSAGRGFIVGDRLTLADVCFVAELALFHNEKRAPKI